MVRKNLKRHNVKIIFPSIITSFSLIAGFAAILLSAQNEFSDAGLLILIAVILDGVDGKVARITNAASEFGVQLDSLADLVSFGVAPATLFYRFYLYDQDVQPLFHLLPVMYLLCGAIRLARFNVTASVHGKLYFTGLPIPSAGGVLIIWIPLQNWMLQSGWPVLVEWADYLDPKFFFRYAVTIILVASISMISNMKFDTFNTFWFNLYPRKYMNYIVFALFLSTLFIHFVVFMFAIVVYYLTVMYSRGLIETLRNRAEGRRSAHTDIEEELEIEEG